MRPKALKSWAFIAAFVTMGAPGASATGDLSCTIEDGNLALALFANTNREHGTIVQIHNSSLTLKTSALAAIGKQFTIEQEHIIQQWLLQRELRIAVNIDNNEKGALLLAVVGQLNPKREAYSGRYVLTVSLPDGGTRSASGRIKGCSAG